jgi:hypothetical protein
MYCRCKIEYTTFFAEALGFRPAIPRLGLFFERRETRGKTIADDPSRNPQGYREPKPGQQDGIERDIINGRHNAGKHNAQDQTRRYTNEAAWMSQVTPTQFLHHRKIQASYL